MKVKLFDEKHGTYMFKCPAGHNHYINTKVQNHVNAQWDFNGDLDNPTFHPSVNERSGSYVDQNYKDDHEFHGYGQSYQCHFIITEGKIHFQADCSHELRGQVLDLPDIE